MSKKRRIERFARRIARIHDDVQELKQGRPPDTAVQKVINILEDGITLTDSVSSTSKTDPWGEYDNPDLGYDYSEYEP